jgi:hypothetical protein
MAPSLLASAMHDHSLGLSASTLRYSHLRELWYPTLVPPFHETLRSNVDFSPLVLATSRLHEFQCRAPMPLSREFPKSRITLFSGPQHSCCPSPPWHVVHSGGSTSLLMTSSGPTTLACLLDSLARGTHSCVHVQSKHGIQWSDPLLGSTTQILSVFQGFRCRKFMHPHILNFHLPKS